MPHELCWKQGVDPPKCQRDQRLNWTLTEIIWGHDVQLIKVFIHNLIRKRVITQQRAETVRRYTTTEKSTNPPEKKGTTPRGNFIWTNHFQGYPKELDKLRGVSLKQNWANVNEQFPRKMTHFCVITSGDFGGVPDFEKLQNEMPWFKITQPSYEVKKCQEIGWISWCLKLGSYRQIWTLISIT